MTARAGHLSRTIAGTSVWNGRFPGPITFGWDGESEKRLPRLWSAIPVSAATMPAPKVLKSDWISETTFPCWSAAVRYTVSPAATCHGPEPRGLLAPSPASDDRLAGALSLPWTG